MGCSGSELAGADLLPPRFGQHRSGQPPPATTRTPENLAPAGADFGASGAETLDISTINVEIALSADSRVASPTTDGEANGNGAGDCKGNALIKNR
jgi:hypothetical protein